MQLPDETKLLDRTLDWLSGYLEWFGPDKWDRHFPPREFAGQTILELLLLCGSLRRGPRAENTRELVADALDLAGELVRQQEFRAGLNQVDEQFRYQTWLLGLLHRLGRPVHEFRTQVRRAVDAHQGQPINESWTGREILEAAYFLNLAEFRHTLPDTGELFRRCAVERYVPGQVDEGAAYEITHILWYATDLGRQPLPRDERLIHLITGLLAEFIAVRHYDLVAELLLCAEIVGAEELLGKGWELLAEAQLPDGAIPGPPFQSSILAERSGEKAAAYVFRTCYHPTVVTALAAAERECHD